ncbi:MAG TPA: hypothetical protein VGM11_10350 [Acidobacteriaceae bacterium]|jgi:hypothetical protein
MLKNEAQWISFSGRALAVVAVLAGSLFLHAQTTANDAAGSVASVSAQEPIFHLQDAALSSSDTEAYSSSSDEQVGTEVASNTTDPFHFLNAMQYGGGRQRYGRPRYRGSNTNADGSPKWDFFVGGGFNVPTGQFNYATTKWGFGGGGGRMFNAHVGVNLEFNYDEFGMTSSTLNDQENLYNTYIDLYNAQNPGNTVPTIQNLDGNNHVWSFTLDPVYNLRAGEGLGAYIVGGGGFYHKVADFTVPAIGTYCDPYYGCYQYSANQTIDHYTSNAFGVNVGAGVTYKFSRFANQRLYGEVRYVYMFNSYRPGVTINTPPSADNAGVYNDFPQNSQRTSYFPVKFGLRF